jgi:excisionase family DNA binding protein
MQTSSNEYEIEKLYKVEEAAKVLNVSRAQIYNLIAKGLLISMRVGHCTRIHPKDLRAYMKSCLEGNKIGD